MGLTAEQVIALLIYDPHTGKFFHRTGRDGVRALSVAGSADRHGYIRIHLKNKKYFAHRLAFLIMIGRWPAHQVDHVNGVRHDNRWSNLREATRTQNTANSRLMATNALGVKGVDWRPREKKFRAQIKVAGKKLHLGYFASIEEASDAYVLAANCYFGEFACVDRH